MIAFLQGCIVLIFVITWEVLNLFSFYVRCRALKMTSKEFLIFSSFTAETMVELPQDKFSMLFKPMT